MYIHPHSRTGSGFQPLTDRSCRPALRATVGLCILAGVIIALNAFASSAAILELASR